ncbi:hypothetical protein D3C81_1580100 [compost metagenome]
MGLDGNPAQGFGAVTNQVPGRMQAGIELSTLFVDLYPGHSRGNRLVDVMHNPIYFLGHAHDLTVTNPAGITGLAATLGMKQRRLQHDGKLVFAGRTFQDFHIGLEVITMEKEAKRHIPRPY